MQDTGMQGQASCLLLPATCSANAAMHTHIKADTHLVIGDAQQPECPPCSLTVVAEGDAVQHQLQTRVPQALTGNSRQLKGFWGAHDAVTRLQAPACCWKPTVWVTVIVFQGVDAGEDD